VRGSPEILVHVGAVGAKGRTGKGPLRGLWRLAVCGGDSHRSDARVRVGGAVPWPEVPVRVEALLDGNNDSWIFGDAPRCGAQA
jgi:hypothetical protein